MLSCDNTIQLTNCKPMENKQPSMRVALKEKLPSMLHLFCWPMQQHTILHNGRLPVCDLMVSLRHHRSITLIMVGNHEHIYAKLTYLSLFGSKTVL